MVNDEIRMTNAFGGIDDHTEPQSLELAASTDACAVAERAEKLRRLKASIEGGTYHVSSALTAESLLRRMRAAR